MARYGIVALLSFFYVAGSVWFIQSRGQAYRAALARGRQTDSADTVIATGEPAEKAHRAAANPGAVADASRPAPPPAAARPASDPPPPPSVVGEKAQPASVPTKSAGRPLVASTSATPATAAPANVPKRSPRPEDRDPFWKQSYLTKVWDLDHFTARDENALGEDLHNLIVELNPPDNGTGRQRVIEATRQLLDLRANKDIEYTFTILNSDIPNAFSHPGGFIYISHGLLDMIAEDEDYLLEFVIGHEVAHVELHHALQCLMDQRVRKFTDGTLQKLYFLIIPHAYPKSIEFAADNWVYQRMQRLGRSEHDRLAFLRKLDTYAKANGFDNGQGKVEELYRQWAGKSGAAAISPVENHLRAHTAAWERLDHLKKLRTTAANAPK